MGQDDVRHIALALDLQQHAKHLLAMQHGVLVAAKVGVDVGRGLAQRLVAQQPDAGQPRRGVAADREQ